MMTGAGDRDLAVRMHVWLLRVAVVVAAVGWTVMTVGFLGNKPILVAIAGRTFVAFVVLWGLSNGAILAWLIRVTIHAEGWKRFVQDCRQHPFSAGLYGLLTVFFFWVAWFVAAALVKQ